MGNYNLVREARRKQIGDKSVEEAKKKHDAKLFGEQLSSWFTSTRVDHVLLCLHEGAHLLYTRDCGFEPELHGPHMIYIAGDFRDALGSVQGLPDEIAMTADPLLVGKHFLGPAYIEEKFRGEDRKKQIWEEARGDLANYDNWYVRRHQQKGDVGKGLSAEIREAVYSDYRSFSFHQKLYAAAREYERRVFGREMKAESKN